MHINQNAFIKAPNEKTACQKNQSLLSQTKKLHSKINTILVAILQWII